MLRSNTVFGILVRVKCQTQQNAKQRVQRKVGEMTYKLSIPFRLPGMNEYTAQNRRSPYEGAKMKKQVQEVIALCIRKQLKGVRITKPVTLTCLWTEPNRKRDKDNIAAAIKFILDALVKSNVLSNDGWAQVTGFNHRFAVNKNAVGVVVEIKEEANE